MSSIVTKQEMKSELFVFRHDSGKGYHFPERLTYNPELANGLASFFSENGYQLLPGLSDQLQTFESGEAADRFVVTATYDWAVLVVFLHSITDFTRFMKEHLSSFPVWPYLFMPDEKPSPNNVQYAGPFFKPAYPRF